MAIADKVCMERDRDTGEKTALDSHRLKEAKAVRELSVALGEKFLKFFVYGAVEGNTLVFYLNHPTMVSEFSIHKENIVAKMRNIYREKNLKEVIRFRDVKADIKHRAVKREDSQKKQKDRATGDFEILAKDESIRGAFEKMRRVIKESHYE